MARAASAVLGTIAVWLLYLAGRAAVRTARVGLLAAALLAVAFLPVFYATSRSTTCRRWRRSPRAVGPRGRPAQRPRARLRARRLGLGLAGGDEVHGRDRAAGAARGDRRAGARAARAARAALARPASLAGAAARSRALPRRQPVRAARLPRLPRRPAPPVRRLRRGARQARPHAGQRLARTTCGRFGWGLGWVAALAALGGALPAAAARAPLARSCSLPAPILFVALHGLAGALLRALAHAGAAVRLPARGDLRGDARRRAARAPRPGAAPVLVALVAVALLRRRGSSTRVHDGRVLSRADTRGAARATGCVAHVPAGDADRRRAGRRPTAGRRTSARASPADAERQPLGEVPDEPLAHRPDDRATAAGARAAS